jgi:nucleoside phosphorylase
MTRLLVCTALGVEARALRSEGTEVAQVGMGPRRAAASLRLLSEFDALVVAGFGGATVSSLRPGDVVVADEVRREGRTIPCPWAPEVAKLVERSLRAGPEAVLVPTYDAIAGRTAGRSAAYNAGHGAAPGCSAPLEYRPGDGMHGASGAREAPDQKATALRDRPLPVATPPAIAAAPDPGRPAVVIGPVETLDRVASRATLVRLASLGVSAVDMESFPLAEAAAGRPFAVVRVVVDNPDHPLLRPSTVRATFLARSRLRAIGPALRAWAADLDRDGER